MYFPPGRYLVSRSISVYFGTQIVGDANNWPTIIGASSFVGLGVLSTDVYVENGGTGPDGGPLQWYINTARFYSQIRNIRIDIRATPPGAYVAALHYQVAQATTLENVEIIADSATVCAPFDSFLYSYFQQARNANIMINRISKLYSPRMEVEASCLTSHLRVVTSASVSSPSSVICFLG